MTPAETAAKLRQYNQWRRGNLEGQPMPDPREIGEAIDAAVEMIDRLEAAESECLEQARLNGMGASREAALLAKLEAAEKERDTLRAELETERMRLAACGVVAFANTPDSAKQAREMRPEYWSASCGDVARMVDENIKLRAKIEAMEQQEPVAWQTRTRPAWNDGTWGAWRKCSEEYAEDIKKTPSLHDWLYEARALYALPGAKGE